MLLDNGAASAAASRRSQECEPAEEEEREHPRGVRVPVEKAQCTVKKAAGDQRAGHHPAGNEGEDREPDERTGDDTQERHQPRRGNPLLQEGEGGDHRQVADDDRTLSESLSEAHPHLFP